MAAPTLPGLDSSASYAPKEFIKVPTGPIWPVPCLMPAMAQCCKCVKNRT